MYTHKHSFKSLFQAFFFKFYRRDVMFFLKLNPRLVLNLILLDLDTKDHYLIKNKIFSKILSAQMVGC